jgi:hypothetical protein
MGKTQEPLTNPPVRLETISNHEFNITAAPNHLGCRETPKSNKQSAANSMDQVPLDATLKAMHLNLTQSHKNAQSSKEMSGGDVL